MELSRYLERILLKYSGTFDIYRPYSIEGEEYPAYGYFHNHLEKYVLVREANLWASDSYEHVLFLTADRIGIRQVEKAQALIREYMEPVLVRKKEKLPEKNHMYSFLTVILLSQESPDPAAVRMVKKYSYDKGYQFQLRGFSNGQLALVSMEDRRVVCNRAASKKEKVLKEVFADVDAGKPGFQEICDRDGIEAFRQEKDGADAE